MSNQYPHIDENAIAKYLSGDSNASEIQALMDWIETSNENLEEFVRYEKVWSAASIHKSFDANNAWININYKISSEKRHHKFRYYRIATAVAAIALIVVFVRFFNSETTVNSPLFAVVSNGSVLSSTLPDGSSCLLSEYSKLEYEYEGNIRLAKLSGKVFFSVKKDSKHRFIVKVDRCGVEVLGTKFTVNKLKNSDVMVDVLSGKVKVFLAREHKDTLSMTITNGETAVIMASNDTILKQTQEASAFYSINKTITFRNVELPIVAVELAKCYSVKIKIDNAVDKNLRFSSSFKSNSITEILTVVTQTLNLDYVKKGNMYYIKNKADVQ